MTKSEVQTIADSELLNLIRDGGTFTATELTTAILGKGVTKTEMRYLVSRTLLKFKKNNMIRRTGFYRMSKLHTVPTVVWSAIKKG